MTKPKLQIALDLMNLPRATQIAEEAVEGGVDWIESGTLLIKSEGMESVRALKKKFPDKTIVADLKTADVGGVEVEMASKAGAQVCIVLGISDNGTITEAVRAGKKYGSKIMVDMLGVENKIKRAKEVEAFGANYICVHVGIDEQMTGGTPLKTVTELAHAVHIPIAAAGGLNTETVADVVKAGASVIIVGGAITKAPNVTEETKKLKEAITEEKVIPTKLFKKYSEEELFDVFSRVSTSNISDAMHRKGVLHRIKPLKKGYKLVGKAVTVRTYDGDWAKPVEAIDVANKGEVIIIDACRGHTAVWGELASWSCKQKGIAGVVIDGAVRDVEDLLSLDFPVFARHFVPNAGEPKGFGEIGAEITIGGRCVKNGDWIVGDDSGVVAIPQERAREIANRAMNVREQENRIREEIKRGSTLSKVVNLRKWEKVVR
ncbi:orotidine 5'-phosphate decarboxylase [archaeon]|nr:orotidine 5'-phosphate decarboxylase [archaeon]